MEENGSLTTDMGPLSLLEAGTLYESEFGGYESATGYSF
jgi:hypothetical protein